MFKKWFDGKSKTGRISIWFVGIYAPLMLLIMGISWAYYLSEESQYLQVLRHQEAFHVELQIKTFRQEFQSVISDLLVLSAHQQLALIADGSTEADYAALADELLSFCRNKKMYDQVRLLDATGKERVRINFNHGHPVIVPKSALKNQANRYYFKDTIRLKQGELFVSPLDLNVEDGTIERPLKPMIRFGMPVFNNRGEKRGILVLNYFAELLITQLESRSHNSLVPGFGMLLNSDGYFFKGMQNEDEWGFMIPGRTDRTFSHLFPKEWGEITRNPSGQVIDSQGLFTFATVFPLAEGLKSSTGSPDAWGDSVSSLDAKQYLWKIVTFTPHASILGMMRHLRQILLFSNALFALLAGICIWLLSGAIISRKKAHQEIEQSLNIQRVLDTILNISLPPLTLKEVLLKSLDAVLAIPAFGLLNKGAIFLVIEGEQTLEMVAQRNLPDALLQSCARLAFGHCLCGKAAATRELVFFNHLNEQHEIRYDGIQPHGHYCIPIISDGRLLGVLNAYVAAGHISEESEKRFLNTVADTLAVVIKRKQTEEQLRQLAHNDTLTGLPNRTLFYDRLNQGLALAQRHKQEFAVMFLDLDHFKEINDTLGHDMGDTLLRETANRLLACVRKTDTVARMGGDEFTVILGETKAPGSVEHVAKNILKTLLEPFSLNGTSCNIGCSIGIAIYPQHGRDSETLLKHADTAMYDAKRERNTYRFFNAS